MGKPAEVIGRKADFLEQLSDALFAFRSTPFREMDFEGFAHDLQDCPARVQRTERILKDHLNLPSPGAEFQVRHRCNIGSGKSDGTGDHRYQF